MQTDVIPDTICARFQNQTTLVRKISLRKQQSDFSEHDRAYSQEKRIRLQRDTEPITVNQDYMHSIISLSDQLASSNEDNVQIALDTFKRIDSVALITISRHYDTLYLIQNHIFSLWQT